MSIVYYNEIDPFAASWLRELIQEGLIADGFVDERDIRDVVPTELFEFKQCHFFAGIGGWPYALRSAGWSDETPVWTGSPPCQSFSAAGQRRGFADERHLWPAFFHLISQCRPPVIFGEQVASKDALAWLDLVQSDLEGAGYAVGAADLCAASAGAPHIRQRLFFVADARGDRRLWRREYGERSSTGSDVSHGIGDTTDPRQHDTEDTGANRDCSRSVQSGGEGQPRLFESERTSATCELGNASATGLERRDAGALGDKFTTIERASPSHWSDVEWLQCSDGKARPTKPGVFPLAHGIPNRVGTLRGAGNAIVAPLAAEFVKAFVET